MAQAFFDALSPNTFRVDAISQVTATQVQLRMRVLTNVDPDGQHTTITLPSTMTVVDVT